MERRALTAALKCRAAELGFALRGVCAAVAAPGWERLQEWLAAGYAGEMSYLAERLPAYEHPRSVLDGVRCLLLLGMPYRPAEAGGDGERSGLPSAPQGERGGRVACYAWGRDYHDVIHERLHQLADFLRSLCPDARVRGVVDTAPLLEREFAQLAGLGWVGKNTLLLNRDFGSWFFLAALLTDCDLELDAPFPADHCGTCRACLDACPTNAFPQPYVLDASRCISYLTIERRGPIPVELRAGVGEWLFGCDICQDVCPWNRRVPPTVEPEFAPRGPQPIDLPELFTLSDSAFRERFRHTPLWRAKRRGLLRNAAIVLGNRPTPAGLVALQQGLADPEPLVRGACAWALGQYEVPEATAALRSRRALEADPEVLAEIDAILGPR